MKKIVLYTMALACIAASQASAALIQGANWTTDAGDPIASSGDGTFTIGDGTALSASDYKTEGTFDTLTLVNVGDVITFTATIQLDDLTTALEKHRYGIWSASDVGYKIADGGGLHSERPGNIYSTRQTTRFVSGGTPLISGTYDLSIAVSLLADDQLNITTSLFDGTTEYAGYNYDTTVASGPGYTKSFSYVSLSSHNSGSSQIIVTGADVSYTAIPEPATFSMLGMGALITMFIRRRLVK